MRTMLLPVLLVACEFSSEPVSPELFEDDAAVEEARIGMIPAAFDTGLAVVSPDSPFGAGTVMFEALVCGIGTSEFFGVTDSDCRQFRVYAQAGTNWRLVLDEPLTARRIAIDRNIATPTMTFPNGISRDLSTAYKPMASALITQLTTNWGTCSTTTGVHVADLWPPAGDVDADDAYPFSSLDWRKITCQSIYPGHGNVDSDLSAFYLNVITPPAGSSYAEIWERIFFEYDPYKVKIELSTMQVDTALPATSTTPEYQHDHDWVNPPAWYTGGIGQQSYQNRTTP